MRHGRLLDSSPEPAFDRWTAALRRDTGAAVTALLLVDAAGLVLKSLATAERSAPGRSERPHVERSAPSLLALTERGVQGDQAPTYAETPVSVNRELIGWVVIAGDGEHRWSEAHRQVLEDAAAAISAEIGLRFATAETARVRDLLTSHNGVHELIARAAPLQAVLDELVAGIERYDPSVIPCVVLLDRESSTLHPGAGPSLPPDYLAAIDGVVIGPNIGTCGSAAWSGRLTITEDIGEDPKWAPIRDFVMERGLRHCWSMPIKGADNEVLGTLALYGSQPRLPLAEHISIMRDGARLAGIAIERDRAMDRLMHDARHDGLTGLANRTAIFERLDDAIVRVRTANHVAVLFVDLDGLKLLNDTFGHDRADEMIREIGERLSAAVRPEDFVGRFGGDEFVVIAEGVAGQDEAADLGARLLEAISQPIPGVEPVVVTASIGIAMMSGNVAGAREAIRQADAAMYSAKNSGRDRCGFFGGTQHLRTGRHLSIARELHHAEARGEMHIVFQPVFEVDSREMIAVEALLRWASPTLGEVLPTQFVPVAEDTGVIVALGAWVLRESCETLVRITEAAGRPLELGVNVSAHQVTTPGFAQSVRQTLLHSGFPAALLTLEITETSLLRSDTVTARTLRDLRALGVRIVLDDFGTGYSSLALLKRQPLDAIKIDRSFVTGLPADRCDTAVVAGVIGIATALGCTVTAEGVETEEQLAALRVLGCERVQGFLLGSPVAAEELTSLLSAALARSHADEGASPIRRRPRTAVAAGSAEAV